MAEQNIKLPDLDNTLGSSTKSETSKDMQSIPVDNTTSGKEMVIAFGAVLIAAIIFFIVKNYVSKMLVANQRKSPRSADMAGWSLFSFLLFAAITAVLAILNSTKFLSLPYLIPLGLAMIVSLIMFFVALLSKR
jgi:phosphate starvation-inducible membrane PsiE